MAWDRPAWFCARTFSRPSRIRSSPTSNSGTSLRLDLVTCCSTCSARYGQRYDLIVYINGDRSIKDCRRAPDGTLVIVGGSGGRLIGPIGLFLKTLVLRRFVTQKLVPFMSTGSKDGLVVLRELIEAGKVTPVIDRTYPLSETASAIRYLEGHHARAKVVITM